MNVFLLFQKLDGIWLQNLEENVFFIVHKDIKPYPSISCLSLKNCSISLQEGMTRRRTMARNQFTNTLAAYPYLTRLDLSQNCFAGVFDEIGDALKQNLVYLNIRECDLIDRDVEYLANSRHAKSLRHLNISRVCGLFPDDDFAVSSRVLVDCLKNFSNITVIHLQQNQMTDQRSAGLCDVIRNHWPRLKCLNILDNIFSTEAVITIVQACAEVPSVQVLKLPYAHNMLQGVALMSTGRAQFEQRVRRELKSLGRDDINVEISNLAYAILANA